MTATIEELLQATQLLPEFRGAKARFRLIRNGISFQNSKEYYQQLQEKFNKNEFSKNTEENFAAKLDLACAYILGEAPFEKNEHNTRKGEIILKFLWDKQFLPAFSQGAKFYMEGKIIPRKEKQDETEYRLAMFQKVLEMYNKALSQPKLDRFQLDYAEFVLFECSDLSTPQEKKLAIEHLMDVSKKHNGFSGIACYNLGLFYREQKDMNLALRYFEEAAKFEKQSAEIVFSVQTEAAFAAARIYHYYLGDNCDIIKACRHYQLALDTHHLGALISYANLWRLGEELPKDREKAKQLFLKGMTFSGIDNNDKSQIYHGLGNIYLEEGNLAEAQNCLKMAIQLGNHNAKLDLAIFYLKKSRRPASQAKKSKHSQKRTSNQVAEAVKLLNEVAQLVDEENQFGDTILVAQFLLANCMHDGRGMIQNKDQALKNTKEFLFNVQKTLVNPHINFKHRLNVFHLLQAILAVSTIPEVTCEIAYTLGYAYFLGISNAELSTQASNAKNAFELFQQAAEMGHAKAIRHLALCYQYGRGVAKNESLAMSYWEKLAAQQDKQAYRVLGEYYLANGQMEKGLSHVRAGLEGEEQESAGFERSIKHTVALYNLAMAYRAGEAGLKQNIEVAVQYFEMAVERGELRAALELGKMYRYGCGEGLKKDLASARKFYFKAKAAKLISDKEWQELQQELNQELQQKLKLELGPVAAPIPAGAAALGFMYQGQQKLKPVTQVTALPEQKPAPKVSPASDLKAKL